MRIGLNAQILTDGRTGVTRFAKNVIQLLPEIGSEHEFIVFGNHLDANMPQKNVTLVSTPAIINSSVKRIVWEQAMLPHLIKNMNIDLMYYPDHTSPVLKIKTKVIITVHDVSTFAVPETIGIARRLYKQAVIKRSVQLCDAIITGSEATKNEMIKFLPNSANKISVVLYGIEESFEQIQTDTILSAVKVKYHLTTPYILFVGTIETRKNIVRIIRAFANGQKKHQWKHRLVLVGTPGYGYDEIERTIAEEGMKDLVTMMGYVDNNDLSGIYSLADALIYPSLYEGFGFPPLEAMKCGCPVIASSRTSLPEVIGDAGILVNPCCEDEIMDALHRVITDKKLHDELVQKGKVRIQQFTWKKTVEGILQVMTHV